MRMYRGTAADLVIPVTNPDGTPFDLTTAEDIRLVVRIAPYSEELIVKTLDPAEIELSGTSILIAHFEAIDVANMDGHYTYDARFFRNGRWYQLIEPGRQFVVGRANSE